MTTHREGIYSAFNMGTGEAAVISMLEDISTCPAGSLILIEEIEMAIHPSAQERLAQVLVERALDCDLQIVCTSHSRWFIDALPRASRILIQPQADSHECIPNVTTRMAEGALFGKHDEEVAVVCEDPVGQKIIESGLPAGLQRRVKIIPSGAKTELCRTASVIARMNPKIPILIAWDGDVSDDDIQSAFNTAEGAKNIDLSKIEWSRVGPPELMEPGYLHGPADAPENIIRSRILESVEAISHLEETFGATHSEVRNSLERAALGSGNHHDLFADVQRDLGTTIDHVGHSLARAYVIATESSSQRQMPVVEAIVRILHTGTTVPFAKPWKNDAEEAGIVATEIG